MALLHYLIPETMFSVKQKLSTKISLIDPNRAFVYQLCNCMCKYVSMVFGTNFGMSLSSHLPILMCR